MILRNEGNQQNFDKLTKLSKGAKFRRNEINQQKFVKVVLHEYAKTAISQKLFLLKNACHKNSAPASNKTLPLLAKKLFPGKQQE